MEKKKKLPLGEVKIKNIDDMIEELGAKVITDDTMLTSKSYEAYGVLYGDTSGCSTSCGSSTACC